MNENVNVAEILRDCPRGIELWSTQQGEVKLKYVTDNEYYPIVVTSCGYNYYFDKYGYSENEDDYLFPSEDNHNWNTFD